MIQDLVEKLYKLLCSPSGGELAFRLAKGYGYSERGLIDLMWSKYAKDNVLQIGNQYLIKTSTRSWKTKTNVDSEGRSGWHLWGSYGAMFDRFIHFIKYR